MDLYLAESGNMYRYIAEQCGESIFNEGKFLHSFYYCDKWVENVLIPRSKKFLLDSGAFTFFSKGGCADWEKYIKRYASFINRNNIELFFELDIDKLVGYEKVLFYRKKLEDMTGKPVIPCLA